MNATLPIYRDHTRSPSSEPTAPLAIVLTEASSRAGLGHVGRCLAVWEELEGEAAFALEGLENTNVLSARGVTLLPDHTPTPIVVIDRREPTGLQVLDAMHAQGRRVCLLDDPGEARSGADLVIDPPTGLSWTPTGGRRLAGFEHALVRRDVRAAARRPLPGIEVLLSMGGSDPEGLTPALAQALRAAGVSVLTVIGTAYRGPMPVGDVLESSDDWPRALAGARLLVGRFGHTLLEAAHLGTPTLAVATSEPADEESRAFSAHGTSEAIRVHGPNDARAVAERALALLADPTRLAAMATRGRELVDGQGAARVATALRELVDSERATTAAIPPREPA